MNQELWKKVEAFDLEQSSVEYGFSIRLAHENYWSKEYTLQAILEYKKFMYLAATADFMVSPSKIIDIVWHQHLIFTQSYHDFCDLLGKNIQHVPSTHHEGEHGKFKQAKERTHELYKTHFGNLPATIWNYQDMYQSLHLPKTKTKIRTGVLLAILAFVVLAVPFYYLLKPLYLTIGNPDFMFWYLLIIAGVFLALRFYNNNRLKAIVRLFDKDAFVFRLEASELIFMKDGNINSVIHAHLNEMIDKNIISVDSKDEFKLKENKEVQQPEQRQIAKSLSKVSKIAYADLMKTLLGKPVFTNIESFVTAFKKYITKSKPFATLFYVNLGVLLLVLMIGFIRLTMGVLRDKPTDVILVTLFLLTIVIIYHLRRLPKLICTRTLPGLYKKEILPVRQGEKNLQWDYFIFGATVLTASLAPLISHANATNDASFYTSCGSSCGSSCSSCGGCGSD
jgi:hypothetical protein